MTGEKIYKVLGSGEESGFVIDDAFLDAVEDMLTYSHKAWDMEDPKAIIAAAIAVFMKRYEVKTT